MAEDRKLTDEVKRALARMVRQAREASHALRYYHGDQPLKYTHERLRDVFGPGQVRFIQNWCSVVVNATLERMEFKGWDTVDEEGDPEGLPAGANEVLDSFYSDHYLNTVSHQVHIDALVTGNGYLMFEMIEGRPVPYHNSPEQVFVEYDENIPDKKLFGLKRYYSEEIDRNVMMIYWPGAIERWEAPRGAGHKPTEYQFIDKIPNPFGEIPIVHFEVLKPELVDVIPLQDSINKLYSDMMVVAEFAAFKQRWAITNADLEDLSAEPGSIQVVPKGASAEEDTKIGEFAASDLKQYLEAMAQLSNMVAIVSRTPKHYFESMGANISGEALIVMEGPLVKKVETYKAKMDQGWMEVAYFLVPEEVDVLTTWERAQTEQVVSMSEAMATLVERVGLPLITVLKRFGWSEEEIQTMLEDKKEEAEYKADVGRSSLDLAMIQSSHDNRPPAYGEVIE